MTLTGITAHSLTGSPPRPSSAGDARARNRGLALVVLATVVAAGAPPAGADPWDPMRSWMVEKQVRRRGIENAAILRAMEEVPRHEFVQAPQRPKAYDDVPLEVGRGQTMSQAYLTGLMISHLELDGDEKVLEIGTGSGYDAAVLSRIAARVFTVEIDPILAERAREVLDGLGYGNVEVRTGDGWHGWEEAAPFDAILVTTAPREIPEPLYDQLAVGGRMVIATGGFFQDLKVVVKEADGPRVHKITPVRLGPMEGEAARDR